MDIMEDIGSVRMTLPLQTNAVQIPQGYIDFINKKLEKNSGGGRPHFIQELALTSDPKEESLNLLELAWLKGRSIRQVAHKYKTGYLTIWRLLQDLEPFREVLIDYLEKVPNRKVFWNRNLETSDYTTVQNYIRRANEPPYVRRYKDRLREAEKVWKFLRYKHPEKWTRQDVLSALQGLKGGLWSRNCPLDHLFRDLPDRLGQLWIERDKPVDQKVILGGYNELRRIYREIREALKEYYKDKLDPDLYHELTDLKPHDADKIHCNLYWEAKVPIEVLAGQYEGKGEGIGLCGRIWVSTDTIKKHYLSLNQRSERFKEIINRVHEYAKNLNKHSSVSSCSKNVDKRAHLRIAKVNM